MMIVIRVIMIGIMAVITIDTILYFFLVWCVLFVLFYDTIGIYSVISHPSVVCKQCMWRFRNPLLNKWSPQCRDLRCRDRGGVSKQFAGSSQTKRILGILTSQSSDFHFCLLPPSRCFVYQSVYLLVSLFPSCVGLSSPSA